MTLLGNDAWVVGVVDLVSTVVVEDRRLDGVGFRKLDFGRIVDPVKTIADAVQNFGGHLWDTSALCVEILNCVNAPKSLCEVSC